MPKWASFDTTELNSIFTVGEGCDVGGWRAGGGKTITARSAANSAVDTCEGRAKGAGLKEGEWRPLFLGDRIVVGGGGGGKVDGA